MIAALGDAFTGVSGQLYPQVGLQSPGARIKVNFGERPFMFTECNGLGLRNRQLKEDSEAVRRMGDEP